MLTDRVITAVDVHAEGEPGRVLLNAFLAVPGENMADRLSYCRANLEWLRALMLHEPRGYPGLCANLVLPPTRTEADVGLIVMEQSGFTPMSGSNTICVVTALLETQTLARREPTTTVTLDTAVGLVQATAEVRGSRVHRVRVTNVPSFLVYRDEPLYVPGVGTVTVDVGFGGQFFVMAAAADVGADLVPEQGAAIVRIGELVKRAAREKFSVQHPENPAIDTITLAMLYGPSNVAGAHGRNAVVVTTAAADAVGEETRVSGVLDRSPCGTGTCARMAALHAKGQLRIGERFVHEGILGTSFHGELLEETTVGPYSAVRPTISGRGWITGFSQYVLDATDPFPQGYVLGDIWA